MEGLKKGEIEAANGMNGWTFQVLELSEGMGLREFGYSLEVEGECNCSIKSFCIVKNKKASLLNTSKIIW